MKAQELTFPKTSRHHSGVYTCSADNGWGEAAQARIVLDVQVNFETAKQVLKRWMILTFFQHKPEIEQEETFIHTK